MSAREQAVALSRAVGDFRYFDLVDISAIGLDRIRAEAAAFVVGTIRLARAATPLTETMVMACERAEGQRPGGTCPVTSTEEQAALEIEVSCAVMLREGPSIDVEDTIEVLLPIGPANADFERQENAEALAKLQQAVPTAPVAMYLLTHTGAWNLVSPSAWAVVGDEGELHSASSTILGDDGLAGATHRSQLPDW